MPKTLQIGLDIGSSAVRAAEVAIDGNRRTLRHFAQVGLPAGAVVEGEVRDKAAVADALKRLWQHGGFSTKKVVLGLGSQRAMVRQVQMPGMSDNDLRSALKFKIGEFLPIPVEQAVVDFAPLPSQDGSDSRRVLLVAAQRDVVIDEIAAATAAGLKVTAVDSSSLALLRAVGGAKPSGDAGASHGGLEAVVGIGSDLITVVVRDAGIPRFIRTVALSGPPGGQSASDGLPGLAGLGGRGGATGSGLGAGVSTATMPRLEAIVTEVRSSLEYLLSQAATSHFERVMVGGGGAMLPGVAEALSGAAGLPVERARCDVELDLESLGLGNEALEEASFRWLSAVGLALWGTDDYGAPTLLPGEVLAQRQQHAVLVTAIAGVTVVAVGLGLVSYARVHTASDVQSQINASNSETVVLQQKINGLNYVLKVPAEVQSRRTLAANALTGDIDWRTAVSRIGNALPSDVFPKTLTLTKTENLVPGVVGQATASGAVQTGPVIVGSMAMTADTTGGQKAVATFIDRMSHVNGLYEVWVTSTTEASGTTEIMASASLTSGLLSDRAELLPGGKS